MVRCFALCQLFYFPHVWVNQPKEPVAPEDYHYQYSFEVNG
jgi:hypothetical protein